MLALTLTLLGYTLRAPIGPACAARCAAARCDADRCYYGRVDADGNVLKGVAEVDIGPSVRPSLSLSPSEVVEAQFKALSRGRVGQNREGVAGIDSALEFVAPNIVEQYGIDQAKYLQILAGPAYDGLLGCGEMQVLKTESTTDDKAVVNLRVMPKPVTGCVRMSGVADQSGITWWTHYNFHLTRQQDGAFKDCWMVEQMFPAPPPVDVDSRDGTPQIAQEA